MGKQLSVGDSVQLVVPENPRLDGSSAVVTRLTPWGAHCSAPAAATGMFRALFTEMEISPDTTLYTGDMCIQCGSMRMRRTGACKVCEDCGESGGCS